MRIDKAAIQAANTLTSLTLGNQTQTGETLKANLVPDLITSALKFDNSGTPSVNKWAMYNSPGFWVGGVGFSSGSFDFLAGPAAEYNFYNNCTNIDGSGASKRFQIGNEFSKFHANQASGYNLIIENVNTSAGVVYGGISVGNGNGLNGLLFKVGQNYTTYKNIAPNDLGFYNTSGNISILCESGNISFVTAGVSRAVLTLTGGNLLLDGDWGNNIYPARHSTANTAGNNLTIYGGWASSLATDKAGGLLLLAGGVSTGNAESGVRLYGCGNGASGTTDAPFYINFEVSSNKIAFFAGTPAVKQTITGSRGGNAALADLLTKLATYGLITDSTTA